MSRFRNVLRKIWLVLKYVVGAFSDYEDKKARKGD